MVTLFSEGNPKWGVEELGFCVRWISRGNSGVQIGNQVRGCVDRCIIWQYCGRVPARMRLL